MSHKPSRFIAAMATLAVVAAACSSTSATASPASSSDATQAPSGAASPDGLTYRCSKGDGQLNGAGATFIYPLLSKMTGDYNAKCGVKINYQSIGSGGGVKQWTANTVDFGATDAFLKDSESKAAAGNGEAVHIPMTFGAVVVAYNLPGVPSGIKMNADLISGLFAGKITRWNDAALKALNPDVNLPDMEVSVVHRSDGSGTTSIFTTYLTSASAAWVDVVGKGDASKSAGKTVEWPVGIGASGNEGVTQGITQNEGAVGYIELAYAVENKIAFADVVNKSGNLIRPSIESIAAAANLPAYPADLRFDLANTEAAQGYPITGTTWVIVYKDLSKVLSSKARAEALVDFLWWAVHEGQAAAAPLNYGSIPSNLLAQDEAAIQSLNWAGAPLLP